MRLSFRMSGVVFLVAGLILDCGFGSVGEQGTSVAGDADVLLTAAPVYVPLAALQGGERFPNGSQLLLVHAGKAVPLVAGFAATADANVGFDGKTVLFAGKRAAGDAGDAPTVAYARLGKGNRQADQHHPYDGKTRT